MTKLIKETITLLALGYFMIVGERYRNTAKFTPGHIFFSDS